MSDESGRPEIYVQPYPGPGGKWLISTEGGTEPAWNRNGRELFYRSGNKMMAVETTTQPTFTAGKPRVLFEGQDFTPDCPTNPRRVGRWPAFSDGEAGRTSSAQINVVQNWFTI